MCQGLSRWWDYRFKRIDQFEKRYDDGDYVLLAGYTQREIDRVVAEVDRHRAERYARRHGVPEVRGDGD